MTDHKVPAVQTPLPLVFMDVEAKGGTPTPSMMNARIALNMLGVECSYDEFHDRRLVAGIPISTDIVQVTDDVCLMLRRMIRQNFKFDPGTTNMWDAMNLACREGAYNPILDYLDALEWDGVKRIDTWLIDYAGAPKTPFVRAVSRLTLIASVRRVRKPGCKFDFMTVLESGEGKNKSKALATLYGDENFSDQSVLGISDKELMEALRGRWGHEAADLSGMRKGDVDKIKAQLSRQADRGRPAYGRVAIDVPRTCVQWGTTNDRVYLRSQTGNRRFWPIPIERFDIARLQRDRDQLWAEANFEEFLADDIGLPEKLWADATAEQEKRTHKDPWLDELADLSGAPTTDYQCKKRGDVFEERITSRYLLGTKLGISAATMTPAHTFRLADAMKKLGWNDNDGTSMRIAGNVARGYKRTISKAPRPKRSDDFADDDELLFGSNNK